MNRIAHLTKKAQHNKQACEELCSYLLPKIYAFVASRVQTTEIAEDLTHEIFIKIIRNLSDVRVVSNKQIMAWFFTIARNRITDHYRTHKETANEEVLTTVVTSDQTTVEKKIDHAFAMTDVRKAMRELSDIQQECISLKYFSDLSTAEIAESLQLKPKTVSSHLSRGLHKLRTVMETT